MIAPICGLIYIFINKFIDTENSWWWLKVRGGDERNG